MIFIRYTFLCFVVLFAHGVVAQDKIFQAGAAALDITPFLGGGIIGNYGNPPEAKNIHDPLMAKALVLDDGDKRLALIIVDNLGLHAQICQLAKERIMQETGISVDHILIASTHTHSGTSASGAGDFRRQYMIDSLDEYQQFLIHRLADATKNAIYNLRPARIGFGRFDKPEHVFNRRWYTQEPVMSPLGFKDSVMMNPGHVIPKIKPAGPTDPEVAFIAVESKEGKPIAVLANYSLHYVGGEPPIYGVPDHDISADYYGAFARHLAKLLKTENQRIPFVGIMSQGTSGDINNINFATKPTKSYAPYEKIDSVSMDIATDLVKVYSTLTFKDWVSLSALTKNITLQVRKATPALLQNLEKVKNKKTGEEVFHRLEDIYLERVMRHEESFPDQIDVTLQAFAIGDIAVGGIPFEVFAETGLQLKQQNPFKNSFTFGIANGYWGYLPTPGQHRKGGYETWLTANKVEIEASEILKEELLELFRSIK